MCAISLCVVRIGLGWAHDELTLHVTCSCIFPCICTSFHIFLLLWTVLELFWLSLSFPFLFLFTLVVSMAPKHKSTPARNPLHSGASSSSDHAPLSLHFRNMMPTRHLWKTFLDKAFNQNVKSSWVIFLTPTFPLSFTIGNESLFVTSPSLVLSY